MIKMQDKSKIPPRLSEIRKENPFSTPDNYFDEFPGRIRSRITAREEESKVFPTFEKIWQVLRPQLALVAIIAGFAFLGYHGFRFISEPDQVDVSGDQISEFFEFQYYNYDHSLLLSELDEEDLLEDFYQEDEEMEAYIEYLTWDDNLDLYAIVAEF